MALFAVYFFWGTTYLGIRMALEAVPPALLIGLRFILSGGILLIALRVYGSRLPDPTGTASHRILWTVSARRREWGTRFRRAVGAERYRSAFRQHVAVLDG